MRKIEKRRFTIAALVIVSFVLLASVGSPAQEKPKKEVFQAVAMGQGTQMGRTFSINIIIEEYSTPEDQQALLEAFKSKGMKGLSNALSKMKTKGRLSMTGTLGYDISYIRSWPTDGGGRKIRLVTERPIVFGEVWADSRTMDYSLSAVELDISSEKGKSTGTLLPACQFKLDKENHIEIENYKNPWKLVDILDR